MSKIFIVELDPTMTSGALRYKRVECVDCGSIMISQSGTLHDAERHLCPIDKRTVGVRAWRAVVRDAFLDGHDAEAIAIIAEMEPDRLRVNFQVRAALAEALTEIERHNRDYHHVTPDADIDRWKKIGDLK